MILTFFVVVTPAFQIIPPADFLQMPSGKFIHKDCIHFEDEVLPDIPCPHIFNYSTNSAAPSYYSDWVAYSQTTHSSITHLSSKWVVPPKPKWSGPVGLSSVYFFNGLEDGDGQHGSATYILQPVLQFGKSGCLNNPLLWKDWFFSAYYVSNTGRAKCGKRIKVETGEKIMGNMTQSPDDASKWTVSAIRLKSNEISSYTATLSAEQKPNAAYITLEGMLVYGCNIFPPSNGIVFTDNVLMNGNQKLNARWKPMLRHQECDQSVSFNPDQSVYLFWNSTL